jgi:hypothetical protein
MLSQLQDQNNSLQMNQHNPSDSNNNGEVLNHILRQINSLKCENLELKKMMNPKGRAASSKKVSISQNDFDVN